jgi:hypothetical protein
VAVVRPVAFATTLVIWNPTLCPRVACPAACVVRCSRSPQLKRLPGLFQSEHGTRISASRSLLLARAVVHGRSRDPMVTTALGRPRAVAMPRPRHCGALRTPGPRPRR